MTDRKVGYGMPPKGTRFKKGQSGNPRGRPKNRHREIPYDAVLGQTVTVRENGEEKRMTAAEAFLLRLTQNALSGDSAATQYAINALETAQASRALSTPEPTTIKIRVVHSGTDTVLDTLGMAILKYPRDEKRCRWELNPWIVEAALDRLGDRQLTETEQRKVWNATRTPNKVNWPDWWTVKAKSKT